MRKYVNYHKHDHISSFLTPDTHIKAEEYVKRAVELGDTMYFTTNHGTGGDIFEAKTLCEKYGLRCMFGIEGYIVANPLEKDKSNYHIILIPRTNEARKKLNYVNSHAHIDGYYYKPRIFIDDLLALDKDEIYLTTACVAGILKTADSVENIFEPLVNHFGQNMFIEVQAHDAEIQSNHNIRCLNFADKYGLKLIAATDSHYIYPEQAKERQTYLEGKGMNYGDEDTFLLDYPDGDTLYNRFVKQGILSPQQINEAMANTFIFESCEEIYLDKEIKMPTIYPQLSADEKVQELRKHVYKSFENICKEESISDRDKYIKEIEAELKVVDDTKSINTADYFLFNERNTDLAVNKYGGILTRTGRGSCGAFYLNKLLGMTQIDMVTSPVRLYSQRFMSTARLLENKALPDIDFNVVAQEPFQKASKELLGEHGCYPMIAYGTMQDSEAFRNLCRSKGLAFDEYTTVSKSLDKYANDEKWKSLIDESKRYVGAIVSASVHPCAHILDNKDLRYEYGVVRVGDNLCVMITSAEADEYKVLKNDYLIVSVWKLISETFAAINKPIMTIQQLDKALDSKTFDLFKKGLTATLNQVDGDWATSLMKQYQITNVREGAMFTAALRPSFESWRDMFISRVKYDTGCPQFDEVLKETGSFILFQENLMQYFEWLGVSPAESISLIKKISKKKIKPEDFSKLEDKLHQNWIKQVGNDEKFQDIWNLVQSCMSYGFAAPHAVATAYDMLYGAYLKSHYPLDYYTVCFNNYGSDESKTAALTSELASFGINLSPIKFRHSSDTYSCDKSSNTIYKSISSVKYLNAAVSKRLYDLRDVHFDSFIDFLKANPCDTRQTDILIKLDFFSEFGKSAKLQKMHELFQKYFSKKNGEYVSKKSIKKTEVEPFNIKLLNEMCDKETPSLYQFQDLTPLLVTYASQSIPDEDISWSEKIAAQLEYLNYIQPTDREEDRRVGYVREIYPCKRKADEKVWAYNVKVTFLGKGKNTDFTVYKARFDKCKLKKGSIFYADQVSAREYQGKKYWYLTDYHIIKENKND